MWDITPAPPTGDRFIKTDADTQVPKPFVSACVSLCVKQCVSISYTGDNEIRRTAIKALFSQHVPKLT